MQVASPTRKDYSPELYNLYTKAVVRFAFYPFETYTDTPQEASMYEESIISPLDHFADDLVAEQWLILHPSIKNFSAANLFEPVCSEMYSFLFVSHLLITRNFCRFHDSSHFNHIQVDLWERICQSVDYLLTLKSLFHVDNLLRTIMGPCLETISRAMKAKYIVINGNMKDEHVDISCVGTLSLILLYAKANEIGCHITWICSNYWWDYIQVLFVAATLKKDNLLLEWTKNIMEARCAKRYTPEYHRLLPEGDSEDPWQWSFEQGRIYERASAAAAALLREVYD